MLINKIFGALLFILGGYLLFAIWFVKDTEYETLIMELIGSSLFIYFGLLLMGFL